MALPIGGFMPIPLAMMIPFMATQSMVMGDAFGQAFQYGKRKISAMSNEEFNNTSMEQLASQMFKAYQNIIPDLKQSIEQSRSLQSLIVTELLRLPTSIFQEVVGSTGDARSIRKDTSSPIGTEVDGKVIVGYIDGVPQYQDIPKPPISRRTPTTTTQQSAEKALVLKLKAATDKISAIISELKKVTPSSNGLYQLRNVPNYSGAPISKSTILELIAYYQKRLPASALNYSKKAQAYKNKYGQWL